MRLARIYQQQPLQSDKIVQLTEEAAHHLIRVLRLKEGAEFIIFNGEGGEFKAKLIAVQKKSVSVQIGAFNSIDTESPLQIILAQSLLRPEKMDYVLQKSVELGVTQVVPLITERCVVPKLSPDRWEKRLAHWQAIMINACEQSGRTRIPTVTRGVVFKTALSQIKADARIILAPNATQTLPQSSKSCHCAAVLVGPEGGWSENEMNSALTAGYLPRQLGPRILRTETAGLVALTLLQAAYGDISPNLV